MKKIILLFLLSPLFLSASQQLQDTRSIVKEWVATEQALSKEAIAWKDKETLLKDLIRLVKVEIDQLSAKITTAEAFMSTADKRRDELVKQEKEINENTKLIEVFLRNMERKLRLLEPQLPKPLNEQLESFYQRLPSDPQKTSLGVAERMQTIVAILSNIQKFDDNITVVEEIKELSDGTKGVVKILYVGLTVAYYLSSAGDDAGYGYPSESGWVWESLPKNKKAIADSIAIAENSAREARFISLPITLKNSFSDELEAQPIRQQ